MHTKCRYFSRKNLATGGVEPTPQMPLTVKGVVQTPDASKLSKRADAINR